MRPDSFYQAQNIDLKLGADVNAIDVRSREVIALHLVDGVSRPELESLLKTPNGLHAITHAVFKNETRMHVDSVAFTIPQTIKRDGLGTSRLSGQVLVLNNPSPKFLCDDIRTVFR